MRTPAAIDLKKGNFAKFKLGDVSAGRVAIGNFRSPHVLDFVTVSYSVPGYFGSPIPLVLLYEATPITAEKLKDEVLFRVPRPDAIRMVDKVEFLDVAGQKMALVVVPPSSRYPVKQGDSVKFSGQTRTANCTNALRRQLLDASTIIVKAEDHTISTRNEGAVFVLFEKSTTSGQPPFTDMSQLRAHNLFPLRFPSAVRHTTFPWVKVEDAPWANGRLKGDEFYNLVGFHVRYVDDSDEPICHIQLWTAGVNVSAGFHNHIGQSFAVAFEFPPFISLAKEANVGVPEPGRYRLINAKAEATAAVEGGESTDSASLVVLRSNLTDQTWDLETIPGTNLYALKSVPFASSDWPVENGQKLIGTRSLAALGVTNSWNLDPVDHQKFQIRLVDTNLVWSVNKNDDIVLTHIGTSQGQDWIFENVNDKN
ncbi:hypothetical protein ARMSODRAFT_1005606 [Armillaria solidipes]|uniref:Aldos-2-ulose dehydratase/isomerase (AUDH) Cupin domain-containing protein n=1 Tax=Armillaria solidipes TaxID=1076256 RepID=A0A2H3BCC7_9AGAR|nr:hypothetical protein ARMSODRAFT_1005606 [Armillaria solidipes]